MSIGTTAWVNGKSTTQGTVCRSKAETATSFLSEVTENRKTCTVFNNRWQQQRGRHKMYWSMYLLRWIARVPQPKWGKEIPPNGDHSKKQALFTDSTHETFTHRLWIAGCLSIISDSIFDCFFWLSVYCDSIKFLHNHSWWSDALVATSGEHLRCDFIKEKNIFIYYTLTYTGR